MKSTMKNKIKHTKKNKTKSISFHSRMALMLKSHSRMKGRKYTKKKKNIIDWWW